MKKFFVGFLRGVGIVVGAVALGLDLDWWRIVLAVLGFTVAFVATDVIAWLQHE